MSRVAPASAVSMGFDENLRRAQARLGEAAVTRARAHPAFRATAVALAAAAMDHFQTLPNVSRWLLKDLGRAGLYASAIVLDGQAEGVTVSRLTALALAGGIASRGRVRAFVEYALRHGHMRLAPAETHWTSRRLTLTAPFYAALSGHFRATLSACEPLAPEVAIAAARVDNLAATRAAVQEVGRLVMWTRLIDLPRLPPVEFFMQRDGGLRLLQFLVGRRAADRGPLLDRVRFSKTEAARLCGVSRVHIDTLLADAQAGGLLAVRGRGDVAVSAGLDEAFQDYLALQIQALHMIADAILASENVDS